VANLTNVVADNHAVATSNHITLTDDVANLTNDVADLTDVVANNHTTLTDAVANLTNILKNIQARQMNSTCIDDEDALDVVYDAEGNAPPNFPPTLGAISALDGPALTALLQHYGVPSHEVVAVRRQRFKKYIGIHP
jgi:hypothetical protein